MPFTLPWPTAHHIAPEATPRLRQPTYATYVHCPMWGPVTTHRLGRMPATRPRQVLLIDTALALTVGALAYGSTRWDAWWDRSPPRDDMPMRHGGPPFRVPDPELTSTAWSVPWLVGLSVAVMVAGLVVRRVFPR